MSLLERLDVWVQIRMTPRAERELVGEERLKADILSQRERARAEKVFDREDPVAPKK